MSTKEPYFGLKGGWLTFWISVACATDMTLFGYDQGVFGGVIVTDDFLDTLGLRGATATIGTVTAIYDIGCFVGAISAMWIGEKLGRRKTILLGTSVMTIGAILQISAYSVAQMIIGRVIAGIGNGINTSTAPVWQSETAQAKWRGKLVVIEMIMNIAGFSLSNWMTYGFSFLSGPITWRFPLAFQLIFIMVLYCTVPWLPESPRWLIAHEKEEEAFQILADLEGLTIDDPYILTQHKEIVYAVQYERENTVSWSNLLRGRTSGEGGTCTMRRLLLGAGTQAMQQLSGINVTSYYLPTVLINSVHFSNRMARLLAACNSVSYLIFSFIGIPNVERWGRRGMLMYAAAAQSICYLCLTVLLRFNELSGYPYQTSVASASVAFIFLYYVAFGIGMQGVPWLYPVEINSLSMRTKGAALATSTNWIFNFMVVEITPIGIQNLQWRFYLIWTIFNAAFVPTIYFLYPETAGRTLEDMDRLFREDQRILIFKNKEAISKQRPLAWRQLEEAEVRRQSSIDAAALRKMSRVGQIMKADTDSAGPALATDAPGDEFHEKV